MHPPTPQHPSTIRGTMGSSLRSLAEVEHLQRAIEPGVLLFGAPLLERTFTVFLCLFEVGIQYQKGFVLPSLGQSVKLKGL